MYVALVELTYPYLLEERVVQLQLVQIRSYMVLG
jgi:hypothetical protein